MTTTIHPRRQLARRRHAEIAAERAQQQHQADLKFIVAMDAGIFAAASQGKTTIDAFWMPQLPNASQPIPNKREAALLTHLLQKGYTMPTAPYTREVFVGQGIRLRGHKEHGIKWTVDWS